MPKSPPDPALLHSLYYAAYSANYCAFEILALISSMPEMASSLERVIFLLR
eukprot:CAMPEP_0202957746 /NCGR_PEP_ID=MMETSP1396-20130829/2142_1 /ASSEMBLY_ACC=CAM_ASM_000872 /TAXON_ID= /ORGANISM="Pseudokeronopsis sp., Strain Brazil" /LENGTH=50 /DNA_ID=CAMNT_0049675421 /DNA_START=176 /DNA_END=328 /DNA_ORIENTATION=+